MDIRVGFFNKTHGMHGEIRMTVFPETGWVPKTGASLRCIANHNAVLPATILEVRKHQNFFLVKLAGVTSREEARQYTGCEARASIPSLPDHAFLINDLIGASVKTSDGRFLGKVVEVLSTPAHDIFRVVHKEKELLIPALKSVIVKFDSHTKELRVELPEGMA